MEFAIIVLAVAVVAAAAILAFAPAQGRRRPPAPDPRLDTVLPGQGEIAGQFRQTVAAQEALSRTLAERLEALDKRLGESLTRQRQQDRPRPSAASRQRLTRDRRGAEEISALSGQVVSLQQVLSNKQARGAFGQAQMEEIVRDELPPTALRFPVHAFQPQPARLRDPHSRQRGAAS